MAGGIPFVLTTLPQCAMNIESDSILYGRACNPWNKERTTGGSSGGEGGLVGACCSPLGVGTDIGGTRFSARFVGRARSSFSPQPRLQIWCKLGDSVRFLLSARCRGQSFLAKRARRPAGAWFAWRRSYHIFQRGLPNKKCLSVGVRKTFRINSNSLCILRVGWVQAHRAASLDERSVCAVEVL